MFSKLQDSTLKLYVNLQTRLSDERGQDLIEYALLAGLIAVICVATIKNVGSGVAALFTTISTNLATA